MKSKTLIAFSLILFSIFSISIASAQQASCTTIQLSKQTYLSGELFQAEVSGNFQKALTLEDISFHFNNQEYSPAYGFEQAASNKWVVWMNAPKNFGQNTISVKALCKSDILREETISAPFEIQRPLQEAYSSLIFQVDNKWSSLSDEDLPLALKALSYNSRLLADAKAELLSRSAPNQECWPKSSCKVRTTAMSVDALKSISNMDKAKNWLLDSENNVKIGLWDLIVTSSTAQSCSVTMNSIVQNVTLTAGTNSPIRLTLPDDLEIVVSTDCAVTNAKISHTYLGSVHDFAMSNQGGLLTATINNKKCWGILYRSGCDATSTAYALATLSSLGQTGLSNELNWLGQNLQSTEEQAIYHSLAKDSNSEQWLINNQAPEGFWSNSALAVSNTPDVLSTVQAIKSLSGIQADQGKAWLKEKFKSTGSFGSIKDTVYALQIFSSDSIEPIISSKGLFKAGSGNNLTIKFSNSGVLAVNLTLSVSGSLKQVNIPASSDKEVTIQAPSVSDITFTYIDASYATELGNPRSYSIPLIVLPSSIKEDQFEDAIGGTSSGGTSLIPSKLEFTQASLNVTLQKSKKTSAKFTITNPSSSPAQIGITLFGLYDILSSIDPSNFELGPNQSREVIVYFDTESAFGSYSGTINAESSGTTISLPIAITITTQASDKTCSELSGTACSTGSVCEGNEVAAKDGSCCLTTCKKSSTAQATDYKKIAGWSMLVLAVLIGAGYFYFKLKKKPQPPLKLALEKIKNAENPEEVIDI